MKIVFTILIWVFLSVQAKSDSWVDHDWSEMIDSSDAIVLIEYINDGDFLAQAKVLKLYRGQLNSDTIWITGFSNRYGPIKKIVQLNNCSIEYSYYNELHNFIIDFNNIVADAKTSESQ